MNPTSHSPSTTHPTSGAQASSVAEHEADLVRGRVSEAYARAIERQGESGCCATTCCGETAVEGPATPGGVAAQTAGYAEADVEGLPVGVAASSFGCGHPLAFAGVERGQTVLDLGSGAGLDLLLAARKVGEAGRVIGVDMTDAMLDTARANIERAGVENVEVRKGLIEDLPVEDGTVDWVISNCVINLSPDKPAVFSEIARVLAAGGRFSISDIVAEGLPEALREKAAAYAACVGGAISEAEYVAGLEAAGLGEIEITGRLVYDAQQLRALVASDLADLEVVDAELEEAVAAAAGRVWSIEVTGRKAP